MYLQAYVFNKIGERSLSTLQNNFSYCVLPNCKPCLGPKSSFCNLGTHSFCQMQALIRLTEFTKGTAQADIPV